MKRTQPKPRPYIQCDLCKGCMMETVWLPKKYAKLGSAVKIKRNGVWDDHWIVAKVYQEADESMLDGVRRLVKKHRQHTDVAKGTFKKP